MLGSPDLKCHFKVLWSDYKTKQIYDINKIQLLFLELGHKSPLFFFFYLGYYTLWGHALCLKGKHVHLLPYGRRTVACLPAPLFSTGVILIGPKLIWREKGWDSHLEN